MNDQYNTISSVQGTLQTIIDEVNKGHVAGLMFQIKLDNGQFMTGWSNCLEYLERVGLIETAKHDMMSFSDDEE